MLVSFVGKTCTFLRLFPALNRRLKNASPASCDALRITFSVTLFCAPNERLDPKMDHRLLVIKNPPRFFFAQPPSRTRRSQLSRAHTHFHTPQSFGKHTHLQQIFGSKGSFSCIPTDFSLHFLFRLKPPLSTPTQPVSKSFPFLLSEK